VQYWRKQGHLILLKRGIYVLSSDLRKQPLSMGFISNFLFSPSYLSLEYALSYYDLIPEAATVYTSVSTKKTTKFNTPLGVFEYRSVKNSLFFGFTKATGQGQDYFIAYPEKAVLDFFLFQ
jgi:predicted transcriptional regulator of viral defense system